MAGPYSTTLYTAQAAALLNAAARPDATLTLGTPLVHGRVYYTLLGTEAAAEIINLCKLPRGARLIPGLCKATTNQDPGTALVLDIGTSGDPDAIADGLVLSAGERSFFDTPVAPAGSLNDRRIYDDDLGASDVVKATFATATALTAGTIVCFDLVFALPTGG